MQTVSLGCGPGGCGCGCGGGFASAPHRHYPKIEGALRSYIDQQMRDGRYFYINPALNTSALKSKTFGDAGSGTDALSTGVSDTATSIGDFFSNIWQSVVPPGFTTTQDSHGVTGSWDAPPASPYWFTSGQPTPTPPQAPAYPYQAPPTYSGPLSTLPPALVPQVTQAAHDDLFGLPVASWIIGGAAALLLVVLATSPRSGRRRA